MVKKENILKATPLEKFEGEHFEDLTQSIPQNMRQVVLEVTENCNLRCDYCIYQNSFSGFRDFSPRSMSEETAIKAIDYIPVSYTHLYLSSFKIRLKTYIFRK